MMFLPNTMPLVELYRSSVASACEQRALVLRAMDMRSEILFADGVFMLLVEDEFVASAREQLRRYETENAPAPPRIALPKPQPHSWIAIIAFAFILVTIAYLAGKDAWRFDWYAQGALTNAVRDRHELWRLITALTLHVDHGHLLRNIGFGALFLYPVARFIGFGTALLAMIVAAIIGNAIDAWLMPSTNTAIGASTMVFAALGILATYSWRLQWLPRLRWAQRWAPFVMGIALLGLLGAGGENVDVIAHLAGFFCGALLALALVRLHVSRWNDMHLQVISLITSFAIFAVAWTCAHGWR